MSEEIPDWLEGAKTARMGQLAQAEEQKRVLWQEAARNRLEAIARFEPLEETAKGVLAVWERLEVDNILQDIRDWVRRKSKVDTRYYHFVFNPPKNRKVRLPQQVITLEKTQNDKWEGGPSLAEALIKHEVETVDGGKYTRRHIYNPEGLSFSHLSGSIFKWVLLYHTHGYDDPGYDSKQALFTIALYSNRIVINECNLGTLAEIQTPEELKRRINQYFIKKAKTSDV